MRKAPNASAYVVASIAFSFLPPWIARLLAVAVLLGFAVLVGLLVQGDGLVLGIVETVRPPGDNFPDLLAEVRGFAFAGSTEATLRLSADVAATADLGPGDLVFATGVLEPIGSFAVLKVTAALALPLSEMLDWLNATLIWLDLPGLHPVGIILAAVLLSVFARVALRVVAAVIVAPMVAMLAFAMLTFNLSLRLLPLPGDLVEPVVVIGAIIGAVIGYKSLLRDSTRLGEHLAAALLGLALAPVLAQALGVSLALAMVAALLGLLVPVAAPVMAAALLVQAWVPLDLLSAGMGVAAAVTAHLAFDRWSGRQNGRSLRIGAAAFQPTPDARGEFPLHQIITPKEG